MGNRTLPLAAILCGLFWITDPGLMSQSILIASDIEPLCVDGTDDILVVVGDGVKQEKVHVWCSNDNAGQSWTFVIDLNYRGWCTNVL